MKIMKGLLKILSAGLISAAIICGILCFYYIMPVHIDNPKGNTDYVWEPNSIWVNVTEGISFGQNDANGFNNKSVVNNPDVLILGSSHMEANYVMQNESTAYLLSQKLNGKHSVYNMGISSHTIYKVCQYLTSSLEYFDVPPQYVIIETGSIKLAPSDVDKALSSSVERTPSHSSGLISTLQKIPFFRAIYHQIDSGLLNVFMSSSSSKISEEAAANDSQEELTEIDDITYTKFFSYLKEMEEKYGTQIVIFYHPTEQFAEDGTIYYFKEEYRKPFSDYSNEYGITFIDMTDRFTEMYYNENHVAHGFCTGLIGTGHLNKYGHAAVADKLYEQIINMEGK